jgi:molecular chaperone GrpE (heat shock protein)
MSTPPKPEPCQQPEPEPEPDAPKIVPAELKVEGGTSVEAKPDPVLQAADARANRNEQLARELERREQAALERIERLELRDRRARKAKSEAKEEKYKQLATGFANRVDGLRIDAPLKAIAPKLKAKTQKGKVVRATERTLRRALERFPEAWEARKRSGCF